MFEDTQDSSLTQTTRWNIGCRSSGDVSFIVRKIPIEYDGEDQITRSHSQSLPTNPRSSLVFVSNKLNKWATNDTGWRR